MLCLKKIRGAAFATLRNTEKKKPADVESKLRQLTRLVKEQWPDVREQLGPSPPVDRTDSDERLALTASNYKYLEKLHFAI